MAMTTQRLMRASMLVLLLGLFSYVGCFDSGKSALDSDAKGPVDLSLDEGGTDLLVDFTSDSPETILDVVLPDGGDDLDRPDSAGDADVLVSSCSSVTGLSPFVMEIVFPGTQPNRWDGGGDPQSHSGLVYVFANEAVPESSYYSRVLELSSADGSGSFYVQYGFPKDYRIPVEPGETLMADIVAYNPWWSENYLFLRDQSGALRFFGYSGAGGSMPSSCYQGADCITVEQQPNHCSPVEGECGMETYPPLAFLEGGEMFGPLVEMGTMPTQEEVGVHRRFIGAFSRITTDMQCVDYPDRWIAAAIFGNQEWSQCHCDSQVDCALDEVCETEVGRCVPNLCIGISCAGGETCDPYKGCIPDDSVWDMTCETSDDCLTDSECSAVCNPLMQVCVPNQCCLDGCYPGCSPLASLCFECLNDCMCGADQPVCLKGSRQCSECDSEKLVGGDSPYFVGPGSSALICIPEGEPGLEALLAHIHPDVECMMSGVENGCSAQGLRACFFDGQALLPEEAFDLLCQISRIDGVRSIHPQF